MANVYVDSDLGTGANDGTSWTNAYQSLVTAFNGTNVGAGDDVWWKGSETGVATNPILDATSDRTNPAKLHGCKSATTATPPSQSDLIPGWRTGEARTLANRAYKDADAPILSTNANISIDFDGYCVAYGCVFSSGLSHQLSESSAANGWYYEEVLFELTRVGIGVLYLGDTTVAISKVQLKNCGFETNNVAHRIDLIESGQAEVIGLELIATAVPDFLFSGSSRAMSTFRFHGCDFSGASSTLLNLSLVGSGNLILTNCSLHASATVASGTHNGSGRIEFHASSSVTGKSSGTVQDIDIEDLQGSIVEETTAVRTSGASDGDTGLWSLAFTPRVNGTRDQYWPLIGPWMAFKITGDGTAQTVSVSIANSGAGDYNDDDVWLEVMYPSEGGTAQYDYQTSQMNLLGTPTAVADDTGSTWGTGGNNHQTLSVSISPDYVGRAYCRVVFAKNFPSSPETLYVDPLPVVS